MHDGVTYSYGYAPPVTEGYSDTWVIQTRGTLGGTFTVYGDSYGTSPGTNNFISQFIIYSNGGPISYSYYVYNSYGRKSPVTSSDYWDDGACLAYPSGVVFDGYDNGGYHIVDGSYGIFIFALRPSIL